MSLDRPVPNERTAVGRTKDGEPPRVAEVVSDATARVGLDAQGFPLERAGSMASPHDHDRGAVSPGGHSRLCGPPTCRSLGREAWTQCRRREQGRCGRWDRPCVCGARRTGRIHHHDGSAVTCGDPRGQQATGQTCDLRDRPIRTARADVRRSAPADGEKVVAMENAR